LKSSYFSPNFAELFCGWLPLQHDITKSLKKQTLYENLSEWSQDFDTNHKIHLIHSSVCLWLLRCPTHPYKCTFKNNSVGHHGSHKFSAFHHQYIFHNADMHTQVCPKNDINH
jgi:hypothetical protein